MNLTKPLKIAVVAPIIERVPPKKYGGTERIVNVLTEGLVKRGHDVTLFASGDSLTSAKLVSVVPKALGDAAGHDPYKSNALTALHIGMAYKMQDKFDIIHDHVANLGVAAANISKTPTVLTLHNPLNEQVQDLLSTLTNPYVVTVSNNQLQGSAKINHIGTVHNGLNMEHYPYGEEFGKYLLFVGRISRDKGVHIAIKVAEKLNLPLIIAAQLHSTFKDDFDYYKKYVKPKLSKKIQWIGEVTESERNVLMSNALCLLHPISWPEPFGLVLIESMACGTPVVAFGKGAIPEIVKNDISGYVVDTLGEMVNAVLNIRNIDRKKCRDYVLANFSGDKMVDGYIDVYNKIVEKTRIIEEKPFIMDFPVFPAYKQDQIVKSATSRAYDLAYAHDVRMNGFVKSKTNNKKS